MPSTYAHYRFGQEVLRRLPERQKKVIEEHLDLYQIGLHGPDLLFYDHPLRSTQINRIGYCIHDHAGACFFTLAARKWAMLRYEPAHQAYLYGFLCHFALDRACHGYIDEKIAASGVRHTEIEVEFDRMLLAQEGLDPLRQSLTEHIHPSWESARVIADFFPGIMPEQIFGIQKSFLRYNRLLLAPGKGKRMLICLLLRVSGNYKEMHGLLMNTQPNPLCADSNERLAQLCRRGEEDALALILDWEDNVRGETPWSELYRYTFGSRYVERKERRAV